MRWLTLLLAATLPLSCAPLAPLSAGCAPARTHAREEATLQLSEGAPCRQRIDGFGTTGPYRRGAEPWLSRLYYDELGASILRVDLTPTFRAPYAAFAYHSPWFHGEPPLPGPDGNNVRTYRDPGDYGRMWSGRQAPVAVMKADPEQNLALFDYDAPQAQSFGQLAARGKRVRDFKLFGSLWSPAPWLKQSSGNRIEGQSGVMPANGTPWPFVWAGNFAGGVLDASDTKLAIFDDGSGPTSALTQLARGYASYVLGFQRRFGVRFYAVSLQNELNFETFYNSCSYPRAPEYGRALKAVRHAFDAHPELRAIQIAGPEDLLDSNPYALWQYGGGDTTVHKNLQYLAQLSEHDREAADALAFFAAHAYANDGVRSSGADPQMWSWWMDGWQVAPAAGLPAQVRGVRAYGKKSWMTETSSEPSVWTPEAGGALANSALGLALKLHHALTSGEQSAWLYWQLLDKDPVGPQTLTDDRLRARAPKFVALKHFFRFIRPGACRLEPSLRDASELYASAFRHAGGEHTVVVVNTAPFAQQLQLALPRKRGRVRTFSSDARALFRAETRAIRAGWLSVPLPAESVVTIVEPPEEDKSGASP